MSKLMERLCRIKDNRGLMADLRCLLVASKQQRAWPALNRLNIPIDDENKSLIAGLYATHPEETSQGNFGTTCKAIQAKRDSFSKGDDKVTPIERRFQHLLAAERGEELSGRVTRMVLMAKAQGVSVNYEKLETDLKFWSERTRREWATAFWAPGIETAEEVSL